MATPFLVKKVAVLGAGVMGAQIAAHLVNANVQSILFELPAKDGDPNGNVLKAIDGLKKLEPSPIGSSEKLGQIIAANYDQHLDRASRAPDRSAPSGTAGCGAVAGGRT